MCKRKHKHKDIRRCSVSPQFLSPSWVTVRVKLDTFVDLSADKKNTSSLVLVLVLALSQLVHITMQAQALPEDGKSSFFLCSLLALVKGVKFNF